MNFEDLKNPELQEKLRNAKTPEDLLAVAREEGYELTDSELEGISGGDWDCWTVCTSRCGRYNDCPHDHY